MSRRSTRRTNTGVRVLMAIVVITMVLGMILAGASARGQSPLASAAPVAPAASAQPDVGFDPPTATGSLTRPITFSTTFRSAETPDRVELLSRLKDGTTDLVRTVEATLQPDGSYAAELVQGGFTPANSTLVFRFRVTTPSGTATGPEGSITVADDRFDWRTMSGPTVTLHWYEGDDAFAQRALNIGQDAIDQAAALLGVTDVEPVDFFIYSTEEAFRGALAPGARENVGGQANPAIRTMVGNIAADQVDSDWVDTLVTHELTHIVFSDAVSNPFHFPPRWLNEGLAVYLSEGYGIRDRAQVKEAAQSGDLMPLSGIVGLFPTTYDRFSLAYAESVSAVDFFIRTYGKDKLVQLITSYRGGVTDDEAFTAATGSDFAAFDAAWIAAQGASQPQPFGPLPAPAGPLPSDWSAPDAPVASPALAPQGVSSEGAGAQAAMGAPDDTGPDVHQTRGVLSNPRFLALFLSQILTQVGGNMVLYGLTIQVYNLTQSTTSTALLLLTFLVPAVVFGAIAGVFVDRYDRRKILIWTNVARGGLFLALVFFDTNLVALYVITAIVATLTTFFAPAETAMIPLVVKRGDLMTANGLFVLGLQASFALGFAVLGPLVLAVTGVNALIGIVAGTYLVAGALCWTLPAAPSVMRDIASDAVRQVGVAVRATLSQLKDGLVYIKDHNNIFWALAYLTITSSLIGVLGVLGPAFAVKALGLQPTDFWVLVLPLGIGLVVGIVILHLFGRFVPRKRLIEIGLVSLGLSLLILGAAQGLGLPSDGLLSLRNVSVLVAFTAGISYAFVAVPAQTALQEELPEDVRGRVFGVLNTLVSLASFLPIIIVGPVADIIGPTAVIILCAGVVATTAVASFFFSPAMDATGAPAETYQPSDPMTVATQSTSLTQAVKLRYVDNSGAPSPIDYMASPVVPGRAGPADRSAPSSAGPSTGQDE